MAHSDAIVIDFISKMANRNNWEIKTEYGPYGSYYVYIFTDGDPINLAEEALEAMEQE